MTYEIELEEIGPVKEFSHSLEHGLNVLYGNHGSGKTTILRTVQLAVDGRTDVNPTKTDGAKSGKATVAGKTLKISRAVRKEGDLEIEGLGELNLMELHSPNYKDAVTRDKYRIKTLATLAGAECKIEDFYPLLGGKNNFEHRIDVDSVQSDDIVEMAAKVKRAIDKLALEDEKRLAQLKAELKAKKGSIDGVDLDAESDESVLSQNLEQAIQKHSEIVQQSKFAKGILDEAANAKEKIDEMGVSESLGPLNAELDELNLSLKSRSEKVQKLKDELRAAESEHDNIEMKVRELSRRIEDVKKTESLCESWRESISKAESVENPTDEEIQLAKDALDAARKAQQAGIIVRSALKAKKEADEYKDTIKSVQSSSENLREAAKKTTEIVSDAIGKLSECPLKVHYDEDGNARMVTATQRNNFEPIDELSDGERWKLILPLAFKEGRIITLSQASFGELSEETRAMIHTEALNRKCVVLSAQVDTGDLRCELFGAKEFSLHA